MNNVITIHFNDKIISYLGVTGMIISDRHCEERINQTNSVLSRVNIWCENNSLHINATNSKALIVIKNKY